MSFNAFNKRPLREAAQDLYQRAASLKDRLSGRNRKGGFFSSDIAEKLSDVVESLRSEVSDLSSQVGELSDKAAQRTRESGRRAARHARENPGKWSTALVGGILLALGVAWLLSNSERREEALDEADDLEPEPANGPIPD